MKLTRTQIRNLHAALEADPTIEVVEVQTSAAGRLSFWRPQVVETLTRIRITPQSSGGLTETLTGRVRAERVKA